MLFVSETILNIYLVIDKGSVVEFKAKSYDHDGDDDDKIVFLKNCAPKDFTAAQRFNAPRSKLGGYMRYNKFAKLEEQGMHFQLFEEIFHNFKVPENPLICVTPVVDGEILSQ